MPGVRHKASVTLPRPLLTLLPFAPSPCQAECVSVWRVCIFFIYLAVPAVRPFARAHRTPTTGSIDRLIRATLCVQARNFSPPNTTVAELRKGKLQSG
jgi:hypothetical protein